MAQFSRAGSGMLKLVLEGSPLFARLGDQPAFEGERLAVISSPFFPHKLDKGYGSPALQVIKSINGQKVKNLAHAVTLLRTRRMNRSRSHLMSGSVARRWCSRARRWWRQRMRS